MDSVIKNKIDMRQLANKQLLSILEQVVDRNPDIRLGQILLNYQFVKSEVAENGIKIHDPYHEEPVDTLSRVKSKIKEMSSIEQRVQEERKELIEKACEWLLDNFYEHPHERWLICSESFDTIEYMIERFKASME